MSGVYRSRPRPPLSQVEVEALIRAADELLAGEVGTYFEGYEDRAHAARLEAALGRARAKLDRALRAAEDRDKQAGRPPRQPEGDDDDD
jgi:alkylation response protein AidB-like acyl-CoA dehydrogenase